MLKLMELNRYSEPVEVVFDERAFAILESHHKEGFFMEWRSDPFSKILIAIGGEGFLTDNNQEFAIQAPCLIVLPEKSRHRISDKPARPLSLVGLCIRQSAGLPSPLLDAACGTLRIEYETPMTGRIRNGIRELLVEERQKKIGFRELQISIVSRILVELARIPSSMNAGSVKAGERVRMYAQSLESEFWKQANLEGVATSLGLSRRRFTQLFREECGDSWLCRLNRLRLSHASLLLSETSLSVRAVAFECGYADLSHFYRAFKERYEITPGEWRERLS
jgi:AraC family L-rhamnose operon regulatory protein RhaS